MVLLCYKKILAYKWHGKENHNNQIMPMELSISSCVDMGKSLYEIPKLHSEDNTELLYQDMSTCAHVQ